MDRRFQLVVGLLSVVFGAACESSSCNDVTCEDVLGVVVTGVDEFVATLEVPGQDPQLRSCPGSCATFEETKTVVFYGSPASAVVVIRSLEGDEIGRQTVNPDYQDFRPNGPTCPPGCRQATVTVPISLSCGDVSCINALEIRVVGDVPEAFTLVLETPGAGIETRACPGDCIDGTGGKYFVLVGAPATIVVSIQDEAGQILASQEFTPRYDEYRPNGPGCLPVCQSGIVALTLS